jgi:hypothetical protein
LKTGALMHSPAFTSRNGALYATPEIHNILAFEANQQSLEGGQESWVSEQARRLYRPIAVELAVQLKLNNGHNT